MVSMRVLASFVDYRSLVYMPREGVAEDFQRFLSIPESSDSPSKPLQWSEFSSFQVVLQGPCQRFGGP